MKPFVLSALSRVAIPLVCLSLTQYFSGPSEAADRQFSPVAQSSPQGGGQLYPLRPIRLIVPFAPGGNIDMIARLIGGKLTERWGQSVVVDNRSGGGGVIGAELAAKSAADGYTLLMANINFGTNPSLMPKLPYDTVRDFAPISLIGTTFAVLVVHPSLPLKSVGDLIAYAKTNPGKLNYITGGTGSPTHISMELLTYMTGIKMMPVHYKGGGQGLIDLLAGRVTIGFAMPLPVNPHIKAGRLRVLAVSGSQRSVAMPSVPTVSESGVPGYEFAAWSGVVVPAKTPLAIVRQLNAEIGAVLAVPEVKERFLRDGMAPAHSTPEAFASYIRSEIAKWSAVTKAANIGLQ